MGFHCVPSDPKSKDLAEKRIEICSRLTTALFEYLTFNDQVLIDTFDIEPPPQPPNVYGFTLESLMRTQKTREMLQHQIDQIETALQNEPRTKPGVDSLLTMMEASVLTPLKMQLEQCDEHIAEIQKALEGEALASSSGEHKGGEEEESLPCFTCGGPTNAVGHCDVCRSK